MTTGNQKTITACIIGKPNAGKSSLLNRLIGQKLSIVTHKVQTTRSIITGIITLEDTQIIVFDTPGIFEAKKNLERAMVRCAWSSLNSADIVMLIIDSTKKLDSYILQIFERLKSLKIKPILLLNKIDLPSKEIDNTEQYLKEYFEDPKIFKISAYSGKGVDELTDYIKKDAKFTPWLFGEDDITNLPYRFLASELTREQLFLNLHEELPYNLTVQTELWEENKDKSVKINQVIVVSRENYKMMILGKHGAMIKEIGSQSRAEMEKSFGFKVHLFLFVKVRELWESNPEFYNYMGLKLDKKK
jgi:GTP-binding protein Era